MIGNSVVPGLPNRCVMPSSLSSARNAERPVMRFFIGLLQPAAVAVGDHTIMIKLGGLTQWRPIMAALRLPGGALKYRRGGARTDRHRRSAFSFSNAARP